MLRQLQLRAPLKAVQLKRSLTYNSNRMQPVALYDTLKKEPQSKMIQQTGNFKRQYSVCPKPLELQLHDEQQTNLPRSSSNNNDQLTIIPNSSVVALVPLEQSPLDQSLKKPQPQPQPQQQPQSKSKLPEQPIRKVPYYNPLRRRSNVDPARVQYIKDRFKERSMETDEAYKPPVKKFISRTTLHSGRLDKID